jgi:hypothetical protein
MPRPDIKVRMAQDDEASVISNLVSEIFNMGGWMPAFETIYPYWLVAEISGEVVGTINLRISLPVSSIEMLAMDPTLTHIDRTRVAMMLIDSAIVCCGAAGSTVFSCMIPEEMQSYKDVLMDRGMEVGAKGSILFGRIT